VEYVRAEAEAAKDQSSECHQQHRLERPRQAAQARQQTTPDREHEGAGHDLGKASRTRGRTHGWEIPRLRHEASVENVERIQARHCSVPPQEHPQDEEVRPRLEQDAKQDQRPDDARLLHQRRVLVGAGAHRSVPEALLPDKVQFSRHASPRHLSVEHLVCRTREL